MSDKKEKIEKRPPVVVVMGHVDHGKSTLLDYIRKTNVVEREAGGITQCISAYEVSVKDENDANRLITFLDTPGHEAFSKMRQRGAKVADIAILIVSAEDGVKAQTEEAYNSIIESKTPFIVAINKIDRPNANIDRTKMDLAEKGIYLEGMGGDVPFVPISAKQGDGVKDLLDMIILLSDMQNITGNRNANASGIIIETEQDPKRGIGAICIIKNGTLKSGMFVVSGKSLVTTRIFEDCLGKPTKEESFSSPIKLVGFDSMPEVGNTFDSFATKKEAENFIKETSSLMQNETETLNRNHNDGDTLIPIIIKADVMGSIEAIEKEMSKIKKDQTGFKIIKKGAGDINESDIKMAGVDKNCIIVGFNAKMDHSARDLNESLSVTVESFDIIYKMIDWLKEIIEERRPRVESKEIIGHLKVLKTFSSTKNKHVVGGKVTDGKICLKNIVGIVRRDFEIGQGKIVGLQSNKTNTKEVIDGSDCGLEIETNIDVASGDVLEAYQIVIK
jgi:translation initiation factor IF-2